MRSVGLNQRSHYRIFITNRLRITPKQPSARAIHSKPESHPHTASAWGAGIVEGFTFTDAIGKMR